MAQLRQYYFSAEPQGMILVNNETGHFFQAFDIVADYNTYTEEVQIIDYTTEDEQARQFKNVRFSVLPDFESIAEYEVIRSYNENEMEYTDYYN